MNINMNPNGELVQSAVNAPGVVEIPDSFLAEAKQFQELMMMYTCAIRETKTKLEVLNDELAVRERGADHRERFAAVLHKRKNREEEEADRGADAGPHACVEDRQACQVQRHRHRQGQSVPGHWTGSGQPHLVHADGHRAQRREGQGRGAGFRCVLPV